MDNEKNKPIGVVDTKDFNSSSDPEQLVKLSKDTRIGLICHVIHFKSDDFVKGQETILSEADLKLIKNLKNTFGTSVFNHLCIVCNGWSMSTESIHVRIEAKHVEKERREEIWNILSSKIPELGDFKIPIFLFECSELYEDFGLLHRE